MRILIYGCGNFINESIKECFDDQLLSICDFTDSDPQKWGNMIGGKEIIPVNKIDKLLYDFVIAGSLNYADSIQKSCVDLGFDKERIIPALFLESYILKWKKYQVCGIWSKTFGNNNFMIIKNWYIIDGRMECVVCLRGLEGCDVELKVLTFSRKRIGLTISNVITGTERQKEFFHDIVFLHHVETGEDILKISLVNDIFNIPWIGFTKYKSESLIRIENQKRGDDFKFFYRLTRRFPYHDEDYMALAGIRGGTLVDVGANFGQSMRAFYDLTDETKIVSIEAMPELVKILNIYRECFDIDDRIKIICSGVDKENTEQTWYEPEGTTCGSFSKDFLEDKNIKQYRKRILKCSTLDELLKDEKDIKLIKIDVEGFEFRAIQGAMGIIKQYFPIILLEENNQKQRILEYLKEFYELFYYIPEENMFVKNKLPGLNYWLIPKEEYRDNSDQIWSLLKGV